MWFTQHIIALLWMSVMVLAQEDTCNSEDGTICRPASSLVCGLHSRELCNAVEGSLYRHGGSAQAYTLNAPVKTVVCEDEGTKYKVATWPLSRSTRRSAPKLVIRAHLWSCSAYEECCCERYVGNTMKVEIWQARPDGTYSSLSSGNADCRATVLPNKDGWVEFTTTAPGSTGGLGGLGPSGWDLAPYGPPLLHMLVTADDHQPLLIHIPILPRRKTLEQRSFWGSDFRGHAGKRTTEVDAYNVTSWTVTGEAEVHMKLDVFVTRGESAQDLARQLCPSFLHVLPSSFFVEPIAVCAPSLLDFFPL